MNNLLQQFLKIPFYFSTCPVCSSSIGDFSSFPLCQSCLNSLRFAPKLCKICGQADCVSIKKTNMCVRPWAQGASIDGFFANYISIGQTHNILKKWKNHGGYFINKQILKPNPLLSNFIIDNNINQIVTIPPSIERLKTRNPHPPEIIASWLSRLYEIPYKSLLAKCVYYNISENKNPWVTQKRQSGLSLLGRLGNPISYESIKLPEYTNYLLVDDFFTSGRTLNEAAFLLKNTGAKNVYAFALAIRPQKIFTD